MKTLVCGGRDYADKLRLFAVLDAIDSGDRAFIERELGSEALAIWECTPGGPIQCVVHGAGRGADLLSELWAKARERAYRGYPAPWHAHGEWCRCAGPLPKVCRAAGPWRNGIMLRAEHLSRHPSAGIHLCLAFPGAKGTSDMVKKMRGCEIPVIEVRR